MLDYLNDELKVDMMQISPAYAYEKAPDQEHFLGVKRTREIFREAFADGKRKKWRLNHSPLYLDFLEGKVDFECTPWGIPCYTVFGWQRPCYLMSKEGYAQAPTKSCSTRPIGRSTAAASTSRARTAWRTAATSRRPCSDDGIDQRIDSRRLRQLAAYRFVLSHKDEARRDQSRS